MQEANKKLGILVNLANILVNATNIVLVIILITILINTKGVG